MDGSLKKLICTIEKGNKEMSETEKMEIENQLGNLSEHTVVQGISSLLEKAKVDSALEYFKGFRDLSSFLNGFPYSSFLTKQEDVPEISIRAKKQNLAFKLGYAMTGHFAKVQCIVLDRSETLLFTGGEEGLIKMWDVHTGRLLQSFRGHLYPITNLAVSYDNLVLASCDQGGFCSLWEVGTGERVGEPSLFSDTVEFMEFVYPTKEPVPLEAKKGKAAQASAAEYKVFLITNNGAAYKVSVWGDGKKTTETVLTEIEDGMFSGACMLRGKRLCVQAGLASFCLLFDTDDSENRFYILDTDDLLTSAVDVSSSAHTIVASTYSSALHVWRYHPNMKPAKGNMQTRKTFRGREFEGAWEKTLLTVSEISCSLYITDLVFLSNGHTVAAVDSESNLRFIEIGQGSTLAVLKKDFKICAIVPHPHHPWVISLEINGCVKVITEKGEVLQEIRTNISVGGDIVVDTTGSFFFLTDMEGGVWKYALEERDAPPPPKSEFFRKDFCFLRDHAAADTNERHREETVAKMKGLLKVCRKNAPSRTYTMLGEAVQCAGVEWTSTEYVHTIEESVRNQEIASILHLQLDMINNAVFEKEYKHLQNLPSTVVVVEDEDETTLSSVEDTDNSAEDSSSAITIESTSTEEESNSSENIRNSSSLLETETEREAQEGEESSPESAEDSTDSSHEETLPKKRKASLNATKKKPARVSRRATRRATRRAARRQSVSKSKSCADSHSHSDSPIDLDSLSDTEYDLDVNSEAVSGTDTEESEMEDSGTEEEGFDFSGWMLKDTPNVYPLVLQKKDTLVFIPSRLSASSTTSIDTKTLHTAEEIQVKTVAVHPEKEALLITARVQRTGKSVKIEYAPSLSTNDPFIIQQYYLDSQKKYVPGDSVSFYSNGTLVKGAFLHYARRNKEYNVTPFVVYVSKHNAQMEVFPFDVQYKPSAYARDLSKCISLIAERKDQDTSVFYADVSRKMYPDYYEVVRQPISFNRITKKGRLGYYRTEQALLEDIDLLLYNCKLYNEEGSPIVSLCTEFVSRIKEELSSIVHTE
ncbi:hypothetical protein NECID01_0878 [Nematocida sp. AWRm77]|nr:hypothetical protein NECID01_0878 [Nematocida sp. AWRm77]